MLVKFHTTNAGTKQSSRVELETHTRSVEEEEGRNLPVLSYSRGDFFFLRVKKGKRMYFLDYPDVLVFRRLQSPFSAQCRHPPASGISTSSKDMEGKSRNRAPSAHCGVPVTNQRVPVQGDTSGPVQSTGPSISSQGCSPALSPLSRYGIARRGGVLFVVYYSCQSLVVFCRTESARGMHPGSQYNSRLPSFARRKAGEGTLSPNGQCGHAPVASPPRAPPFWHRLVRNGGVAGCRGIPGGGNLGRGYK